ncbi:MAG: NUDIX domain-containing protein [Paracoccaceae bacterium]|nr:MAG: NUDIX domain-containing protein [Paracoccaceae bacterium]
MTRDHQAIRPAATVILWRAGPDGHQVLMGQRGSGAAFMPSKFVFPGGAVDADDAAVPLASALPAPCHARLRQEAPDGPSPEALAAAAIRELHEETGLAMAAPAPVSVPDTPGWAVFGRMGTAPAASPLRFVFRAITPPGRSRRFDARFFLAPAAAATGDADRFAGASGELAHLRWIGLDAARALDLPFITEVVLAEVTVLLRAGGHPVGVPFFDNRTDRPTFRRLL